MQSVVEGAAKIAESDASPDTHDHVTVASEVVTSEVEATKDTFEVETKEEVIEESVAAEAAVDTQVCVDVNHCAALLNGLQSHQDVEEVHVEAIGLAEEVSIPESQTNELTILAHEDSAVREVRVRARIRY